MTPGIYHGVPFEKYLTWDAVSNSSMQPALRSLAHYRHRQPIEETPAMKLGTLVHTGRFEPERLAQGYVVMPAFENEVRKPDGSKFDKPKSSAAYRELVDEFIHRDENKSKEIVSSQQYSDMLGMVRELASHNRATRYLTGGDYEVSILAQDPVTGLMCKGRVDHLHLHGRRIADLKTAADLSEFETVIANRSYHRQLAFYGDMIGWLGKGEITERVIVGVESSEPYCVRCAPLSEDFIEAGQDEYRTILNAIAKAISSKAWPGYESPDQWRKPHWLEKQDKPVRLLIGGKEVPL